MWATISSGDSFSVETDGTFRINAGNVAVVFEIKADSTGKTQVRLKSPDMVCLMPSDVSPPQFPPLPTTPLAVQPQWLTILNQTMAKASDNPPLYHMFSAISPDGLVSGSNPTTLVFQHINDLPDLDTVLPEARMMQSLAGQQSGSSPGFVFVLGNPAHPSAIDDARTKIGSSGLNAGLVVGKAGLSG